MPRTFSFNNGDDREGPGSPISPVGTPPPSYQADPRTQNTAATPGMDDMGPSSVGGGIGGIAVGVANGHGHTNDLDDGYVGPPERGYNTPGADNPYIPSPPFVPLPEAGMSSDSLRPRGSYGQTGQTTPGQSSSQNLLSAQSTQPQQAAQQLRPLWGGTAAGGIMSDGPYQRNSAYSGGDYPLFVNPDEIIDDGDDGIVPPEGNRGMGGGAAAGAAGGAAAGGLFGGLFKSKKAAAETTQYGPVPGAAGGAGAGAGAAALEAGEQKHWSAGSKRRGWLAGLLLGFIVVGAIVGGAVGGILGHRGNTTREKGSVHSAQDDAKQNGDLDKDSSEIKKLMNNKDLHKVFPGVDYTPWGVQYPLCLKYPPSQNNVTRDMAVLSQLTNTVRLYGTDCNQTEMVLHAIDRLELKDMRLWLGVWIESNQTTTDRQIKQLYKILDDTKDASIFKGAIVGNEALFRAGSTKSKAQKNLIGYMNDVRDEIKKRDLDLPVATSDLGDNWNEDLAKEADLVMSNVHPFFAGVTVEEAASWTYTFWTGHDASLTKGTDKKQVISEVGWPSGGGNDCGDGNKCKSDSDGSVATVDNMNRFMEDWVCQALENGTDYFWFEAFDEPWKVQFNTKDENWEDKWGLMDSDRKLKPGLKIPDCGGKTAS